MMRWDVLNRIARSIGAKTYLEIGCSDGECLSRIEIERKWGVDPMPHWSAVKHCELFVSKTSDEFFDLDIEVRDGFDLVFIDSDHRAEVAYREICRVMGYLSQDGVIVLHDSNPSTKEMQIVPPIQGEWTGDVWKAIARVRREGGHKVFTVNTDYGCAVVVPDEGDAPLPLPPDEDLTWEYLDAHREEVLGLISVDEFAKRFPVPVRQ